MSLIFVKEGDDSSLKSIRSSRNIFKVLDTKFERSKSHTVRKSSPLRKYQFRGQELLDTELLLDKDDVPQAFKATPETLINLAANVVDALPMPSVNNWTKHDVASWIRCYGYPLYQSTFLTNMITGRRLLLLDASALSAMNIKNFTDIKHITRGIRGLYFFEMIKFGRSISMANEYHYELYKLYRLQTGPTYDATRRTDLWRRMQLMREKSVDLEHWEQLQNWIAHKSQSKYSELFGNGPRRVLYKCNDLRSSSESIETKVSTTEETCTCMPPCECNWIEYVRHGPLTTLNKLRLPLEETICHSCMPPCASKWLPRQYELKDNITILQTKLMSRYAYPEMHLCV